MHPRALIFNFCRGREMFAIGWSEGESVTYTFPHPIRAVVSRGGDELEVEGQTVTLDGTPRYIVFASPVSQEGGGPDCGEHPHGG